MFQFPKYSPSPSRIDIPSGKRGVIMQSNGAGRITMPLSSNAFTSGSSSFPSSSRMHSRVVAHKILAVAMKSESFAKCLPTQIRCPNPNDTCPSRFVSMGPGKSSPLPSRCLSGLKSSASSPNIARSWLHCHVLTMHVAPFDEDAIVPVVLSGCVRQSER